MLAWLDEGTDSGGETYVAMRRRLVWYFSRRQCASPDDLADETLNRVARRLDKEGTITDAPPARYCYIVARFVFLEHLRQLEQAQAGADEIRRTPAGGEPTNVGLDCLEQCLDKLEPDESRLILEYYRGEQQARINSRRELAARLSITANALAIRASRIRDKLEACVKGCLGRK